MHFCLRNGGDRNVLVGMMEGASGEENLWEQETLGGWETGPHGVGRGDKDTDQACCRGPAASVSELGLGTWGWAGSLPAFHG